MPHGVDIAKLLPQNTLRPPPSWPTTTHHSTSLRLMPLKKRLSPKDSMLVDSQPLNGSLMEKIKNTLEEEKRTPLSHGFSRRLDHHPSRPPVTSSRTTSLKTTSLLFTSEVKVMLEMLTL